jgi:hypothetical protein
MFDKPIRVFRAIFLHRLVCVIQRIQVIGYDVGLVKIPNAGIDDHVSIGQDVSIEEIKTLLTD